MDTKFKNDIKKRFSKDRKLSQNVLTECERNSGLCSLIDSICTYYEASEVNDKNAEPEAGMKRKNRLQGETGDLVYGVLGLSFQSPMRKRFDTYIYERGISITIPGEENSVELWLPWTNIHFVCHIPGPRKANVQNNIIIFRKSNLNNKSVLEDATAEGNEPILFTAPHPLEKLKLVEGKRSFTYCTNSWDIFRDFFEYVGISIVAPSQEEFVCPVAQTGDNGVSYGVEANYKNKDGYLYFLKKGVLWGFRKPMLFIDTSDIQNFYYSNVLQRTFSINFEVRNTILSFDMIDQSVFQALNEYATTHGLMDTSLAEEKAAPPTKNPTTSYLQEADEDEDNGSDDNYSDTKEVEEQEQEQGQGQGQEESDDGSETLESNE
ncbi:histone H3.3 H4 heterotetramer chaperone Rtt106 [Schizosaccharomyces osmophilus]|uniref:Histone H3.3 H4 heterotetramer chaperone Rtt106 n=1 Tax=Schizosaccharomyces osmophilus TaxID=2545709 RepID=A0AAE9WAA6_9SCHI|nr:histone H3.3 H4 heterotetramer chaperone Rtt106 [Schizosaccharomyces osmophilus]WBW72569.1 histone H3.3 H4 heterotetramer chaperone Rtt106 [Schizosaccharomyces osmophilus]